MEAIRTICAVNGTAYLGRESEDDNRVLAFVPNERAANDAFPEFDDLPDGDYIGEVSFAGRRPPTFAPWFATHEGAEAHVLALFAEWDGANDRRM